MAWPQQDRAVEAAVGAIVGWQVGGGGYDWASIDRDTAESITSAVVDAVAPHIAAQALMDAADAEYQRDGATLLVERLLARAARLTDPTEGDQHG